MDTKQAAKITITYSRFEALFAGEGPSIKYLNLGRMLPDDEALSGIHRVTRIANDGSSTSKINSNVQGLSYTRRWAFLRR